MNRQMKTVNTLTWIASWTSLNGNKQELFIFQISEMWQPFHPAKHPLVNALISSNNWICRYNCLARLQHWKLSNITISFRYPLYWQWNSQHLYCKPCMYIHQHLNYVNLLVNEMIATGISIYEMSLKRPFCKTKSIYLTKWWISMCGQDW